MSRVDSSKTEPAQSFLTVPDKGEQARFIAVWLASFAVLAALAWPLLAGKIYLHDDLGNFHLPLKYFYANCLKNGESFLWCPNIFNGFSLHGEGQLAMLHPVTLLLYYVFPFTAAFAIELLLRYPLLLIGTYFMLKRWGFPRDASAFGAMVFAFCGFNLMRFVHPHVVMVFAHVPFLILAIDTVLRSTSPKRAAWAALAVALLTTSQVLYGFPQMLYFSIVIELCYAGVLLFGKLGFKRPATLLLFKLLGILGGAAQLLPTWEDSALSFRGVPPKEFIYELPMSPLNLGQLVAPYFSVNRALGKNTHELAIYAGAVVTVLFCLVLLRFRNLRKVWPALTPLVVLMLISLVMSFGKYGLLYRVQANLPLVGLFRCACRYIGLIHFGIAAISALAFTCITRPPKGFSREPRKLWVVPVLAVVVVGAGLAAKYTMGEYYHDRISSWDVLLAGASLVIVATVLVTAVIRRVPGAAVVLIVFAAADIGYYGISYLYWGEIKTFEEIVESAPRYPLDAEIQGRLKGPPYHGDNNRVVYSGRRSAYGYAALFPRKYLDYEKSGAQRLAGVSWTWALTDDTREFKAAAESPLPYARLLSSAVIDKGYLRSSEETKAFREEIENMDLVSTAVVEKELDLSPGAGGTAALSVDKPGRLAINTTADGRCLLVVAESFHPGWRATIDGEPVESLRVYGDFLGCVVGDGAHAVEFVFCPDGLRRGIYVSSAALLAMIILFMFNFIIARRISRSGGTDG